jgi:glycine cleavage system aminomethyltransferase T
VGATIGTVYLPSGVPAGTGLEVDVFDRRVPATVAADVLVDPAGTRMRG